MYLIYIYGVCKGKQVENFLRKSSIKALNKCIKQFWQSMYFLYFYKIWDLEFVSKYSLSTRQFLISSFYVEKSDTKIHSYLFLCVFLLRHFVMFFGVYFLPLHSMSSTGAVPKTPAPTPSSSFVADAPIQFDLLTPTSQNGGVAPSLPGPPKLVSKACHHACIMSPF